MPGVLPFRGVRYPAADPSDLVCPPYDVIGPHEQRELQAQSSYNAVHLELPEDRPGEPGSRYAVAAERLASWRKDGILRPDARPAYYLVETEFEHAGRPHRRRDLLAALV